MNNSEQVFDLNSLINFFIKNYIKLLLISIIITIIPSFFLINNFVNQKITNFYEYKLAVLPETNNELRSISENISQIKYNDFLYQMSSRLILGYFDYQNENISSESFLSKSSSIDGHENLFKNKSIKILISKFQKDYVFDDVNVSSEIIETGDNLLQTIRFVISQDNEDYIDIDKIYNTFLFDLNNYIKSNINNEFESSFRYYEIDKKNLLDSINKLNELTLQGHRLKILNEIKKLEDELMIAKELNIEYPYNIFGSDENKIKSDLKFSNEIKYSNEESDIKISNDLDVYLQGYRVISNQIDHLKERLNNVSNLPIITLNDYFYNLIKSDYFINPIKEKIYLTKILQNQYEIVTTTSSYKSNSANRFSSINFIISTIIFLFLISLFISYILILISENYKSRNVNH